MTRLFQLIRLLLRRLTGHQGNTAIMFAGLAVSFTFLMVITHYVRDELSYDTFWENAENKYRLQSTITYPGGSALFWAQSPVPYLDLVQKNFSGVKTGARLRPQITTFRHADTLLEETMSFVDPTFFAMFDIEMANGDRDSIFADPSSVILSQTFAARLFEGEPAVGQTFSTIKWDGSITDYQVRGIFKDLPHNSHLKISVMSLLQPSAKDEKNWRNARVHTYLELKDGTDPLAIEAALPELEEKTIPPRGNWNVADATSVKFHALDRLHLFQNGEGDMKSPGNATTVYIYGLVGALLVLIAGMNFVNTMIVQANFRVKEVALRKIYGAKWRGMLAEFLPETFVISVGAFFFAVIGLEVWGDRLFALMGHSGATGGPEMIISGALVAGVAILLALFAGIYPAVKLGQSPPINALRARTASLAISMKFSKWMMSLQFVIAIGIAIVASTTWAQVSYTQDKDLGYDPSDVLIIGLTHNPPKDTVLYQRIKTVPGVLGATRSLLAPTEGPLSNIVTNTVSREKGSKGIALPTQFANPNYFEFYKIALLAGRGFPPNSTPSAEAGDTEVVNIVLNESATRLLGFRAPEEAVGQTLWRGRPDDQQARTIVGVVGDFHDTSFRTSLEPILYYNGRGPLLALSVKIAPGQEQAVQNAAKVIWQDVFPDKVYSSEFLTDLLRAQYGPEIQLMDFLVVTGALSILLSCLGLYATSSFLLSKQQKEFAIRKVHGASFKQASLLALGRAVRPAIMAVFIACPIAYIYLDGWLGGFIYRIAMPFELFALASVGMILVAICSVYMVVYRVANSRMADLLREE